MTERLEAMIARKNGDKTYWTRIGVAWPNKNGPGYTVVLEALPLPDAEGRCAVMLFPPKPKEDRGGRQDTGGDYIPY